VQADHARRGQALQRAGIHSGERVAIEPRLRGRGRGDEEEGERANAVVRARHEIESGTEFGDNPLIIAVVRVTTLLT
jgi:hypothetical protein